MQKNESIQKSSNKRKITEIHPLLNALNFGNTCLPNIALKKIGRYITSPHSDYLKKILNENLEIDKYSVSNPYKNNFEKVKIRIKNKFMKLHGSAFLTHSDKTCQQTLLSILDNMDDILCGSNNYFTKNSDKKNYFTKKMLKKYKLKLYLQCQYLFSDCNLTHAFIRQIYDDTWFIRDDINQLFDRVKKTKNKNITRKQFDRYLYYYASRIVMIQKNDVILNNIRLIINALNFKNVLKISFKNNSTQEILLKKDYLEIATRIFKDKPKKILQKYKKNDLQDMITDYIATKYVFKSESLKTKLSSIITINNRYNYKRHAWKSLLSPDMNMDTYALITEKRNRFMELSFEFNDNIELPNNICFNVHIDAIGLFRKYPINFNNMYKRIGYNNAQKTYISKYGYHPTMVKHALLLNNFFPDLYFEKEDQQLSHKSSRRYSYYDKPSTIKYIGIKNIREFHNKIKPHTYKINVNLFNHFSVESGTSNYDELLSNYTYNIINYVIDNTYKNRYQSCYYRLRDSQCYSLNHFEHKHICADSIDVCSNRQNAQLSIYPFYYSNFRKKYQRQIKCNYDRINPIPRVEEIMNDLINVKKHIKFYKDKLTELVKHKRWKKRKLKEEIVLENKIAELEEREATIKKRYKSYNNSKYIKDQFEIIKKNTHNNESYQKSVMYCFLKGNIKTNNLIYNTFIQDRIDRARVNSQKFVDQKNILRSNKPNFIRSQLFTGPKKDYEFKVGDYGVGYYLAKRKSPILECSYGNSIKSLNEPPNISIKLPNKLQSNNDVDDDDVEETHIMIPKKNLFDKHANRIFVNCCKNVLKNMKEKIIHIENIFKSNTIDRNNLLEDLQELKRFGTHCLSCIDLTCLENRI